MDTRQELVTEIVNTALRKSGPDRGAYLDQACADDPALRMEVESRLEEEDIAVTPAGTVLAAETVTRQLGAGQMVGPYRILNLLGEGGMGVVYRAVDTRLDRTVALKFLKTGYTERFRREAKAISALSQSNIATLYDIGDHEGAPYLVLEYVPGKPLKGPMKLADAFDCAIQIAGALEAAHAAGIVHRDLKPGNVLLDSHGHAKVLDFGLARRLSAAAREGTTSCEGLIVGTAAYMSPEQAEGRRVDTRSDIFAFGSLLYELISGHQAFPGRSFALAIAAVIGREPDPLTSVPDRLKQVLCHCLRKDPDRRWQHISDVRLVLQDLRSSLDGGHEGAPVPGRRWLVPALAATACILLAAAAYLGWSRFHAAPDTGRQLFVQATDEPGQEMDPSLAADGKSLLYASRAAGNWDIYLLRVGGKNPVNLTKDSVADDTQPAFSPDGERIAFRSERGGGGIFLMGATGESVRRLTDFCYLPAWSPDGKEIACSTVSPSRPDVREAMSSQVFAVDVESGKKRLLSGGVLDAVQPSWSPDGRRIAFWGLREGARDIFTVSRAGGDAVMVTQDDALDWDPVWAPGGKWLYFSSNRSGAMNIWRVAVDSATGKTSGEPEPLNVPSSYAAGISFSRDGRTMAYVNTLRRSNLYRADFDPARDTCGPPRPVTQGIKETLYPSISRDGAWVAFTLQGLNEDLAVVRTDGSQFRRVTDDPPHDRLPRWSPDGNLLAFMTDRNGRYEIWTVRADGSGLQQVTQDSPHGGVIYPAWSADGRQISYNLPDEMGYIIDFGKPWAEQQPRLAKAEVPERSWLWVNDWSHDGSKLAGTIQRLDGGTHGVAAYSLESGKLDHVTDFGQLPRWLPDGRRLLFHSEGRIYLADPAGKRTKQILSVPEGSINPYFDVSWDGRVIVFSLEELESDIWVRSPR